MRSATTAEVLRAQEGPTPGSITRDVPDLFVQRDTSHWNPTYKVNEWGVETATTADYTDTRYWVVSTNSIP